MLNVNTTKITIVDETVRMSAPVSQERKSVGS